MTENKLALTKYAEGSDEQKKFLQRVEQLSVVFGKEPDSRFITDFGNKFQYLPISHLETTLDQYFFGHWSVHNFKYVQIANEVCGDLELVVTHPVTGERIVRVGAASIVIMQDKNTKLIDFAEHKKPNALIMGFPKLKAECFKNAVQSLGKLFGRDLNRKIVDEYDSLIKVDDKDQIDILRENIMAELANYTGSDREEIKAMCVEKQRAGEFTEAFAINICHKLGLPVKS